MQSEHFEKFTKNAKLALTAAQKAARAMGEAYIGTEHVLVGLVSNPEALAAEILEGHAITLEKVQLALSFASKTRFDGGGAGLTDPAKKVIEKAVATAARHQHYYVGTEHLLLGILSDKNTKAYSILEELGADPERIKTQVMNLFRHTGGEQASLQSLRYGSDGQPVTPSGGTVKKPSRKKKSETPALDYFSTDLTEMAEQGKLDPVIGRAQEVQRVIQILGRRTKNNPVLIGEPGIGKTAIVEGLAERIVAEEVPEALYGKRILSLDLPLMVAGTKYRGEFEERVKQVIDELKKQDDVVIFIDELHTIVGAGAAEGSMDAAQILKPALARGQLQCVGATTLDEYRKHIEKDAALERRFQPVHVKEPSTEEAVAILTGLRKHYEDHHGVEITDDAIATAVRLSQRYIADRFLPDKAIDLIDEAASAGRLREGGMTKELKKIKDELAAINVQKDQAVEQQDYEKAATFRDEVDKLRGTLKTAGQGAKKVEVTDEDIAGVVGQWTGIPVTKMLKAEAENLVALEERLHANILGQDEAVSAVARSIRRSRVGIGNPKRPMGSFIFLGPTGVGKTELVKVLAREVFGSEDNLVKIDMSEFMERHNVSRLVGAPAGYVGYDEGGKLTEQIRRNPYSVLLFDEVEKAHPEVFNILLQILEDGYLSDAKGRRVDFRNTIIVLTSNVGASEMQKTARLGFRVEQSNKSLEANYDEMKQRVLEQLRDRFKPEFLNRLDQIVVFRPLTKEIVTGIVELQLTELGSRLTERDLKLAVDKRAKGELVTRGFDAEYGARPVRRAIQNDIEDPLAEKLLDGSVKDGDRVRVGFKDGKFVFSASRTRKQIPAKS